MPIPQPNIESVSRILFTDNRRLFESGQLFLRPPTAEVSRTFVMQRDLSEIRTSAPSREQLDVLVAKWLNDQLLSVLDEHDKGAQAVVIIQQLSSKTEKPFGFLVRVEAYLEIYAQEELLSGKLLQVRDMFCKGLPTWPRLVTAVPADFDQLSTADSRLVTTKYRLIVSRQEDLQQLEDALCQATTALRQLLEDGVPFDGEWRFLVKEEDLANALWYEQKGDQLEFFLWLEGRYLTVASEAEEKEKKVTPSQNKTCGWDDLPIGSVFYSQQQPERWMTKISPETARDSDGLEVFCEPADSGYHLVLPLAKTGRYLTGHRVNGLNERLEIQVLDQPGHGGACHRYEIHTACDEPATFPGGPCLIKFQEGPIREQGLNGVSNEALLTILIDRLEGFQSGKFACHDNQMALDHLQAARLWLHKRTLDRVARGVEGTSVK